MIFPNMKARTVNGTERRLPQDFSGDINIVLLAYTQEQQYDVDSWIPFLTELKRRQANINVYELPVLRRHPYVQRKLIDYWMFTGIPDSDVRDRTITLYTNVESFNAALKIENTRSIHILAVMPSGEILWRGKGIFSPAKGGDLLASLVSRQLIQEEK